MSEYVPDNNDAFLQHDAEQEAQLEKRPICEYCGDPIQDDYLYKIDDALFCEECTKDLFRHDAEDYER